ncbi:MAG: gliding motility-associated C-terminal domain-containing protein [Cytophagales bacterium]|nr:gliding motility-associated C-terminal domain-containing protein [Cytophagales bacterium]
MRISKILILMFITQYLYSQTTPTLVVSQTRGCAPVIITVNINLNGCTLNPGAQVQYVYDYKIFTDFNNPLKVSTITGFTYTLPGIYTLAQGVPATCTGSPLASFTNTVTVRVLPLSTINFALIGCSPNKGSLTINENNYDAYQIDWGDGSSTIVGGNATHSHLYTDDSRRTATITGLYFYSQTIPGTPPTVNNLTCTSAIQTQDVFPIASLTGATMRQIELAQPSPNAGSVSFSGTLDRRMTYRLMQKTIGGRYSVISVLSNINGDFTTSVSGLNTVNNRYCFKYQTFETCSTDTVDSDEICTIRIKSATANTQNNTLTWQSYPITSTYQVFANGTTIATRTDSSYTDERIQCKQWYCYRVVASFNNKLSISDTQCVLGQKPSEISKITGFHSSYEPGYLKLFWTASTLAGVVYQLYQIDSRGVESNLDTTKQTVYTAQTTAPRCYYLKVKETCGESAPAYTCPIKVQAQKDNMIQNSGTYTTYINGDSIPVASYEAEIYDPDGNFIRNIGAASANAFIHNPIDTTNQQIFYKIKATLADGTIVYSDSKDVIQDMRLFAPTAFTPNNDNNNETYTPKGLFWHKYEIKIYNRWGQLVYGSDDKTKTWGGGSLNPDLYHVYIRVEDLFGKVITHNGTIQLIR